MAMESVLSFSQLFLHVREPRTPGISILEESIIDFSAKMTRVAKQLGAPAAVIFLIYCNHVEISVGSWKKIHVYPYWKKNHLNF